MLTESGVEEPKTFEKSGESNDIYEYCCFDDQSNLDWIEGDEYRENPEWSQIRKDLWKFFYRPYNYGNNIAPEQKKEVKKLLAEIKIHEDTHDSYSLLKKFSIFVFLMVCLLMLISTDLWIVFAIPLLSYAFFHARAWQVWRTMRPIKTELRAYESEVETLVAQQQDILKEANSVDVEKILWDDLIDLEQTVYYDYFFTSIDQVRDDIPNFYADVNLSLKGLANPKKLIDHPVFPVIPTWGLLQPLKSADNDSRSTGVRAAWEDIDKKIATYRNLSDGRPFYRLWYIQYIFITKKNFSVISFCYDILSKKKYNLVGETHQLNHITNSSAGSEDIIHMMGSEFVRSLNLPQQLKKNIYVSQVKNLKYTMSSGTSYSCLIPSKEVVEGLSIWQKYKNSEKRIFDEGLTEGDELYEISEVKLDQNHVLEIIADRVADLLRKEIDKSSPLTAQDHRENREIPQ